MIREFARFKLEELGSILNEEIIYQCLYSRAYIDPVTDLKKNIEDFRACWKAINAGHGVFDMLTILSVRLGNTKDPMKMKEKIDKLLDYVYNYDEFKGEELANVPWDAINIWEKN